MLCTRCGGLTVPERFQNLETDGAWHLFVGLRCLNCGHIEDDLIRNNRTDGGRLAARWEGGRRWL